MDQSIKKQLKVQGESCGNELNFQVMFKLVVLMLKIAWRSGLTGVTLIPESKNSFCQSAV